MDGITIAGISMQNDLQRLNSISQNLANVLTPGYKREIPIARSFGSYVSSLSETAATSPAAQEPIAIDPSAGTLRYSSNPLDIAVDGNGFFEIETATGLAYTRQGALSADINGRLVTNQGLPIMGTGGEIKVSGAPVTIDPTGDVRQGEHLAGQIKLVRFSNPEGLIPLGNGMYGQGAARIENTGTNGVVRVGYQENSNVNSPQEMIRLTETVRHFESMQKVMQGYDDIFEKAMRKLGEF